MKNRFYIQLSGVMYESSLANLTLSFIRSHLLMDVNG